MTMTCSVHDDGVNAIEAVERERAPSTPLRHLLASEATLPLLSVRLDSHQRLRRVTTTRDQPFDRAGGEHRRAVAVQRCLAEDERREEPLHSHGSSTDGCLNQAVWKEGFLAATAPRAKEEILVCLVIELDVGVGIL